MSERDETDPPEADERNPDGSPKRDLRYTAHEDRNVRVDRELDGSGHLARGDKTRMSVLNFSSRHQARTERDPEFAFRPPPPPAAAAPDEAPAPAAPPAAQAGTPSGDDSKTVVSRLRDLFGL